MKDQLLRQIPVIGRDRLKHRSMDQAQLSGAPNGFITSGASSAQLGLSMSALSISLHTDRSHHSRSSSRGDLLGER